MDLDDCSTKNSGGGLLCVNVVPYCNLRTFLTEAQLVILLNLRLQ